MHTFLHVPHKNQGPLSRARFPFCVSYYNREIPTRHAAPGNSEVLRHVLGQAASGRVGIEFQGVGDVRFTLLLPVCLRLGEQAGDLKGLRIYVCVHLLGSAGAQSNIPQRHHGPHAWYTMV